MNISYNWLKKYISLDLSPERLSEVLTSIGLETGGIEEVESIRGGLRGIVIGKVLTCVNHPDSDHLHITTVDLGGEEPVQIVCGAPNVAAGQTVVVATIGTVLYDGDKEFKIKKSKMRGADSFGMICAEDEIGIGSSHDGIIVIDRDVKPGTPAAEYFGLTSDYVLEVDLTPNRIDAASHFGVARDVAAWLDTHADHTELIRTDVSSFRPDKAEGAVSVEVLNPEVCTRYSGVTIRNVKVAESPEWLRNCLTAIGMRPINNIVDITNFILHGIGQPLHCFDLAKIKGEKIIVRTADEGTPFVTLDGIERKLNGADLMICNAEEPMCIAGVFGGLDSGVTETATDIFIESACFNPTSVRKTARRHGLNTDSSFRFERGVDPNGTMYALKVAALLVKELAGGEICGEPVDIYPSPVLPAKVELSYKYLRDLVGKDIPAETVDRILASLEMKEVGRVENESVTVEVPTYRVDVTRPCDVVEDILRIYGYNNVEISSTLRSSLSFKSFTDSADDLRRLISEQLTATGFNEILNNSLTAVSYYDGNTAYPLENCVRLLNPLSADLGVMRQTLLYGGLESISHNINRKTSDLMFYEFENVYTFNPSAESCAENVLAPYSESSKIAIWITGNSRKTSWNHPAEESSFYDLKAYVLNIISRLGISAREIVLKSGNSRLYAASLDIETRNGKNLGSMGILSKSELKRFDIRQEVFFCEMDWHSLVKLALKHTVSFTPLPKTMPIVRDLALLIDNGIKFAQVEAVVRETEKKYLRSVSLFDVYEGKNLPEGKKSYAISITLQDEEKTMNDKQIDAIMNKIIAQLKNKLAAELR